MVKLSDQLRDAVELQMMNRYVKEEQMIYHVPESTIPTVINPFPFITKSTSKRKDNKLDQLNALKLYAKELLKFVEKNKVHDDPCSKLVKRYFTATESQRMLEDMKETLRKIKIIEDGKFDIN